MLRWLTRRKEKTQEGVRKSRTTWFGKVAALFHRATGEDIPWEEIEELLISADVGVGLTRKLLEEVKAQARKEKVKEGSQVLELLKQEMVKILQQSNGQALEAWNNPALPRPWVILVVGVNGSGKTTSIAKLAHHFREQGKKVILGAADTFRAAGIEQLHAWGQRVAADVISHKAGADPGAVTYDTFQAAINRGMDVAIIDTAGRLHTKHNLMEELKKIKRVLGKLDSSAPHQVLLVMDATTGQNGLAQARLFTEAVGCNGIFLAKLDGTAKGGIVLAIADQLRLPVLFIGTGEKLEDMAPFNPQDFVEALFTPVA